MTDWLKMEHKITPEMEKYVIMLCEAGDADNEFKLLTRYQKVVRAIFDECNKPKDIYVLMVDDAGTMRSSPHPTGKYVTTQEQADDFMKKASWVYERGYVKLTGKYDGE